MATVPFAAVRSSAPQHTSGTDPIALGRIFLFVVHPEKVTRLYVALQVDGRGQRPQGFNHRRRWHARCLRGHSERVHDDAPCMQLAAKGQIALPLRLIAVAAQQPLGRSLSLRRRRGLTWRHNATESCG